MLVIRFAASLAGTNCYVVASGNNNECLVIDPGMDVLGRIGEAVAEHHLRPVAVLLTHGHLDHTWSVFPVCDGYQIPGYIHPMDTGQLRDPFSGLDSAMAAGLRRMSGGRLHRIEPDDVRPLHDRSVLDLVGVPLTVRHGPGHTPGSVSFHSEDGDAPVMFSGDLLFEGSIGRTDLPGGDHAAMVRSLTDVVLPLPDPTVVHPGHGAPTTIGRERATNPFLRGMGAPR